MVAKTLTVSYQNEDIAVISYDRSKLLCYFEYTPAFAAKNIELSPLMMPVVEGKIYSFPYLNPDTFKGLPGMVADSLPDRFGNAVLNEWLIRQGRSEPITPLERLAYTGTRGMGGLEYRPSQQIKSLNASQKIEIDSLVKVAQSVVNNRQNLNLNIKDNSIDSNDIRALLAVGTSAGGARPKAVLAFNKDFTQVRSGQVDAPTGFSHYLMKFDGVVENNINEETFGDPVGYGIMEYVYYLIAKQCDIDMEYCHLLDDGDRRHFVTKRFDRDGNNKVHVQTLTAIAHVDYNTPGSYSYEQLFNIARQLRLPIHDAKQIFTRMAFNMVARNNDDHSKNFAFYLKDNKWRLTPAYDVAYCYAPNNLWVEQHWMSTNGKRKNHTRADLLAVGQNATKLPVSEMNRIIDTVIEAVSNWDHLAKEHGVPESLRKTISRHLLIDDFR